MIYICHSNSENTNNFDIFNQIKQVLNQKSENNSQNNSNSSLENLTKDIYKEINYIKNNLKQQEEQNKMILEVLLHIVNCQKSFEEKEDKNHKKINTILEVLKSKLDSDEVTFNLFKNGFINLWDKISNFIKSNSSKNS